MDLRALATTHPLTVAIAFEAALTPLALLLALALDVTPWQSWTFGGRAWLGAALATAGMIAGLGGLARLRPDWVDEAERLVRPLIESLFRGRGPLPVVLVCALAGIGEELLFRGVIQTAITDALGLAPGIGIAAVAFGALHYLSPTYFLLASAIGIYLGTIYAVTGNLLVPMVAHAGYDVVAVAYLMARPPGTPGRA